MNLQNFVPVKNWENYYLINKDTQQVYSIPRKRILKGFLLGGYRFYELPNHKKLGLHRMMMTTFVPDKSDFKCLDKENRSDIKLETLVINHKDANKLNNSLENLEWCTQAYNNKEAYRTGVRFVTDKTKEQFREKCLTEEKIRRSTENLHRYRQYCKEHNIKQNAEGIKVKLIDKYNNERTFISCSEAGRFLKVDSCTIARAARRKNNCVKEYKIFFV